MTTYAKSLKNLLCHSSTALKCLLSTVH